MSLRIFSFGASKKLAEGNALAYRRIGGDLVRISDFYPKISHSSFHDVEMKFLETANYLGFSRRQFFAAGRCLHG